jgi:hypothetical protein
MPGPSGTIAAWDAGEAVHVRRAVLGATMRDEPSAHAYVENVFSAAAYDAIVRNFPADSVLRQWVAAGAFGNYARRTEINLPIEAERLPPDQRAFWLDAVEMLNGEDFFSTLLERFEPYARARFGAAIDDPSFFRDRIRATLILNQHEADYYLGPHTDRSERVFTCLFYFPEGPCMEHLGTTLYRPLEAGFACRGTTHHDPARFEARGTMPYRPNSVLILARSDVLFHGVQPLTAEELRGSKRRGMQVQFVLHNERPRDACKTTMRAFIPDAMRAESDESVPVRLTNRASADLESGFPFQTRLGYRWLADGREVERERAARTPLPGPVRAGAEAEAVMHVRAPALPGRYVLRLSVVQEGVAWFDDVDPGNGVEREVLVYDAHDASAARFARPVDVFAPWAVPASGFYALERHGDDTFRWVGGDALVEVFPSRSNVLEFDAESGPGMGSQPFRLRVEGRDGVELAAAEICARTRVTVPVHGGIRSLLLRATGGGAATPGDHRILNYRVFAAAVM